MQKQNYNKHTKTCHNGSHLDYTLSEIIRNFYIEFDYGFR